MATVVSASVPLIARNLVSRTSEREAQAMIRDPGFAPPHNAERHTFGKQPGPRIGAALSRGLSGDRGSSARNASLIVRLSRLVLRWHERARQRTALAKLDERMLRDIGITRYDAERESNKPFWQ